MLLVGGESGVGKTRLVQEALRRSRARVVTGRAVEDASTPYGPMVAALRDGLRQNPAARERCGPLAGYLGVLLPELGAPPETPDRETLLAFRASLEAAGIEVLGVTDHSLFHSIYFFDPNGHRIELACPDPEEESKLRRLDAVKWEMLEEWSRTKKAPRHAAWMHEKQLED